MRRAYSAHAASAQSGSLALTARTCSLGTRRFLLFLRRLLGRLVGHWRVFRADGLAAPHLLEVVELAHRGMHDVHHHVAEVDQHPFAGALSLDAIDLGAVG